MKNNISQGADTIFLGEINAAIDSGKLVLPTLPEVALQVRHAIEHDDMSINKIAHIIADDAALSARVIKIANSPLYRGRVGINSLPMAIGRIGISQMRTLVISLVMKQMFQSTTASLDDYFHKAWATSLQVAAISKILVQQLGSLDPEQAMLAGLIHNLGALPIIVFAEEQPELVPRGTDINALVERLSPSIGARLTESWGFPRSLVDVVSNAHDIYRDNKDAVDYVDVVIVARLQHFANADHPLSAVDWQDVPAFRKIEQDPESSILEIEGVAEQLGEVRGLFS